LLGWRILPDGEYRLGLPRLSEDEERLILDAEERFKEAARSQEARGKEGSEALVRELILACVQESGIYLERDQREYLPKMASMHIHGYAFIDLLLSDPSIEEISVIGPGLPSHIYIRDKGWMKVDACFDDERSIAQAVNKMGSGIGRHITLQNPRLDAMLPDGSRLHASLPPVSKGEVTIRRFRARPFSPRELVGSGIMDDGTMAVLSVLMQCDSSIIIAGNTASGKTTTLNALFSFVPMSERVLITEETPEINIPHEHQVRLVASKDMGITLKDLVYDSLRMRPDRMIVGEVRNREEAEALFDVLLAGQARGSYATMHAQSADEAVSRLRGFGIAQGDIRSIDLILVQRRMLEYDPGSRTGREVRKVVGIAEIDAEGKPRPMPFKCAQSPLLTKAAASFGLDDKGMEKEIMRRRKMIMGASQEHGRFFAQVQKELFALEMGR